MSTRPDWTTMNQCTGSSNLPRADICFAGASLFGRFKSPFGRFISLFSLLGNFSIDRRNCNHLRNRITA